MIFWQPFWILVAILEFKENNFQKYRFLGFGNIQLDLFYCFLRYPQAKICKFPDFGVHLRKMANRKKCSTFGVWLQTDLDSAAQNLMETIIKVYICLKTRYSYQRLGSKQTFFGCILLRGLGVSREKNDFSMWNSGISTLHTLCRTNIVEGIVDCLEYLFSNLIEWNRIKCKT